MKPLVALQHMFQAYLFHQDGLFAQAIQQKNPQEAQQRLSIYGNAYVLRLIESLLKDFPGVHSLLGDEDFEEIAREYVQQHPSQFRSIRGFGHNFSNFLAHHKCYVDVPVVAEMAQFEWLLGELFDATDSSTLVTLDDLAAISAEEWPAITLVFIPAWRQLNLLWNTVDLWQVYEEENSLEPAALEEAASYLLWRYNYEILFRPLSAIEKAAFDHCLQGGDMASLCEILCQWFKEDEVAVHAVGFLNTWISQGLVAALLS